MARRRAAHFTWAHAVEEGARGPLLLGRHIGRMGPGRGMAGLTVETLQRVMAAEGPVVSVVHVPAETGKPRGLVVDMTPRLRETTRLLGGARPCAPALGTVPHSH